MAVPAAKPKVPVVQTAISVAAAAAAVAVKVNAPETMSSRLPLFRRTTSQPGLLKIRAVCHMADTNYPRQGQTYFFGSKYTIHRAQSQEEPASI